jgi:D-alanyl-lipoteichoic acid acyltransferase DltB (MBOAT superfamily)
MIFNSLHFLIFFPVVTALYYLLQHKYRWFMLLMASCYFYMAFIPAYIIILAITIIIDYAAGIIIERSDGMRKKVFLIISILSTCIVLFVFKYYNFFGDTFNFFSSATGLGKHIDFLHIILPIGLSFHTFQSLSYVIEVYRGHQKAEKNFGIYSLYVMFYPQLVAGPIERPQNLLHQFYEKHTFNYEQFTDGLKLMLWGFFKKVVIADRLCILVDNVYNHPLEYHGLPLIIATYAFTIQIYCDFSGYSDIAIGAAQVMGFKLMDNFNRPYFSKTISEFWRRWHISLSTWFKDYLYIPLGGNKVSTARLYLNLFIVFIVSGLWHGANWTFIVWGALHGIYQVITLTTKKIRMQFKKRVGLDHGTTVDKLLSIAVTFNLVAFAWIFFRARNITDATYIITHLFSGVSVSQLASLNALGLNYYELFIACAAILVMESIHLMERHTHMRHFLRTKPVWIRWGVYYFLLISIIYLGIFGEQQFIYFQF